MLLPRLRVPRVGASLLSRTPTAFASRRSVHNVPKLRYDYAEGGVPNLMSPAGFSIAWTDYMTLATEKINALTAGVFLPILSQRARGRGKKTLY